MPTAKTAGIGDNNPPPLSAILKEKHKDIFERAKKWLAKAKRADLNPQTIEQCSKLEELFAEGRDIANDADRIREKEKEEPLKACKEIDGLFNGEIRDTIGTDPKKGGLARSILDAAASRRAAIAREEQRKADAAAQKARDEAERLEQKAQAQEGKGQVRQADVTAAQAEGVHQLADELEAKAAAPITEATRDRTAGGRSVSVNVKLECTGVVRAELDLEQLRPYFDQDALVKAVQKALDLKAFTELKGAAIREKAVGRVR